VKDLQTEKNAAGSGSALSLPPAAEYPGRLRRKKFSLLQYLGPAFIISVAYIDPENWV